MSNKSPIDTIQLPQGGGAISGMGEKFSPDLFTGTGNFSVPIAVPPGRNGMQPSLGIGYSTGSGNSPFGLGWNLSIPGVMRQTSKGLPRYDDQKDTFVLSGAEDLVPVPGGSTVAFGELGFVQLYRPRTEGLFARIERHLDVANDYWKVWTKEGLISFYGTPNSAGNDPATCRDPQDLHKVFGWKLSKTVDPFGNFIAYNYERDAVNVDGPHLWEQSYLKTVQWNDFQNGGQAFLTWVEFIYGQRPDPFSEYHQGFEVRTVQRCEEIKIWHDPQLESGYAGPLHVKSYHFTYLDERVSSGELSADSLPLNGVSMLSRVQVTGYDGGSYESMPPLEFEYSKFEPLKRGFRPIEGESLPAFSMAHPDYELVDIFGRGLPDIVQLNGQPRYWKNKGDGTFAAPRRFKDAPVGVHLADPNVQLVDANGNGTADLLVQKPGLSGYFPLQFNGEWSEKSFVKHKTVPSFSLNDPEVKLMDLDGDGVTDVLRNGSRMEIFFNDRELGFHELKVVPRGALEDFPAVSFSDHRVRIANLCGGMPTISMVHQGRMEYWPHFGRGKWGKRVTMKNSPRFPDRYNPAHVILGDLDGDGYDDVIYVQHDQVTIWFNQSGNAFSDPIVIKGTPPITDKDAVRIVDILGTGVPGILWSAGASANASWSVSGKMLFLDLAGGQKPYLMNAMKNNLGALTKVEYLPSTHYYKMDEARPETRWKTPLPFPVLCVARVEVIDLISESKLTTEYSYHHGYWDGEEREYRGFGRVDQRDTETFDRYNSPGLHGTGTAYEVEALHFSPPTETRTWFHLGSVSVGVSVRGVSDWTEADYSYEYWQEDPNVLSRPRAMQEMLKSLPARRRREALRTLRGSILRSELYALDNSVLQDRPYTVSENQTGVARLVYLNNNGSYSYELDFEGTITGTGEEIDTGKYWIFFPHGLSSRSSAWERGNEPLTTLGFQFDYDQYGHALQSLSFAVPRTRCLDWRQANSSAIEPFFVTRSETVLIHRVDAMHYLIGRPEQSKSYEIINDGKDALYDIADQVMSGNWTNESLQGHSINYYDGAAFEGLAIGLLGEYGIVTRSLALVLTHDILSAAYGTNVPDYLVNTGTSITWGAEYPADFQNSIHDNAGYILDPINSTAGTYYVPTMKAKFDFQLGSGTPRGLVLASKDAFGSESNVTYDAYDLLPVETEDAVGMKVVAEYDYRLFQPYLVTNPNGNRAAVRFSPLGFVVESGIVGKVGEAVGDWVSDTNGLDFDASSWMEYDLFAYMISGQPAHVRSTQKEHHVNDTNVISSMMNDTLVQIAYSDGFGRVIQTRAQAEEVIFGDQTFGDSGLTAGNTPAIGVLNTSGTAPNVIVNGWKTENNKGAVIEQWEPYYDQGWDFVKPSLAQYGQKVTMFYDSIGRAVRTLNPDGTEQRVVPGVPLSPDLSPAPFRPTPWESYTYDANDLADITHNGQTHTVPNGHFLTPRSVKIDALGRMIESTDRNYKNVAVEVVRMQYFYDIRGNTLRVDDAIKVDVNTNRDSAFLHVYNYANQPLKTTHIDKGASTVFLNAAGIPLEMRDAKGALVLSSFDELLRPVNMWARDKTGESVTLRQKVVYGDSAGLSNPENDNLLGMPYKNYDEAGLVIIPKYDFKGQPITKTRKVIKDSIIIAAMPSTYRADWNSLNESTDLEGEYKTDMDYDGIGRPVKITLPEDVSNARKVVTPSYNRSGGMEAINLDGDTYVSRIAYNAKGQKVLMAYGNGLMTRYAYDAVNFRLLRQVTEAFTLSGLSYAPGSGSKKQDCSYEYDLAGNITTMTDGTSASGVGGTASLDRLFEYDALYRLVKATGREAGTHLSSSDPNFRPTPDNNANGTVAYFREYEYDRLGNILDLYHHGGVGNIYHRVFNAGSSNPFEISNLATSITYGSTTINYAFDANGNQISEGSSRSFEWDFGDRMRGFAEGTSVRAAYLYDAGGQRVKKIVRNQQGDSVVTVYIDGGFEHLYKLSSVAVISEAHNELHVMDGRSRIAVKRVGSGFSGDSSPTVRYNLEDHLGNSSVTVDSSGSLISREEYFPFGETSFGSFARKRYRFCGKERDEESGLYYYGARYYAAWACRFVSVDPLAAEYPFYTPYQYAGNRPVNFIDLDGLEPATGSSPATQSQAPVSKQGGTYIIDHYEVANGDSAKITNVTPPNKSNGTTRIIYRNHKSNGSIDEKRLNTWDNLGGYTKWIDPNTRWENGKWIGTKKNGDDEDITKGGYTLLPPQSPPQTVQNNKSTGGNRPGGNLPDGKPTDDAVLYEFGSIHFERANIPIVRGLRPSDKATALDLMKKFGEYLVANPSENVLIIGKANIDPNDNSTLGFNIRLALDRAEVVKEFLMLNYGISPDRITTDWENEELGVENQRAQIYTYEKAKKLTLNSRPNGYVPYIMDNMKGVNWNDLNPPRDHNINQQEYELPKR